MEFNTNANFRAPNKQNYTTNKHLYTFAKLNNNYMALTWRTPRERFYINEVTPGEKGGRGRGFGRSGIV